MRLCAPSRRLLWAMACVVTSSMAMAHPWHRHPDEAPAEPSAEREATTVTTQASTVEDRSSAQEDSAGVFRLVADRRLGPTIAAAFAPFQQRGDIACRQDDRWFYVESDGIPDHPLMVGIRNWQQQVPLPQSYRGSNAWQIPLEPVPAAQPRSTRQAFLRGAIAVAVNGIPIFNPLNNRGEDSSAIGELDSFGGHCGRADDYHYHLPPVHLEQTTGPGMPIAYALDGYPIYGLTEPDGSRPAGLDGFNGHETAGLGYHYHATKEYPYLNGGFRGEVVERDGQVDPQPRAQPVREAQRPLAGARIVAFSSPRPDTRRLVYEIAGRPGTIEYTVGPDGIVQFLATDPEGRMTTEEVRPRRAPGGGRQQGDGSKTGAPPPRGRPPQGVPATGPAMVQTDRRGQTPPGGLTVTSPAIGADGQLPAAFTCDGAGISPPVAWAGGPTGTRSYALSLWHESPDGVKSYWLVHGIPPTVQALPTASRGIGVEGLNDRRRSGYEPMCSRGPGAKTYHLTIYALGEMPRLSPGKVTREQLLAGIADAILAEGTLSFTYTRKGPL